VAQADLHQNMGRHKKAIDAADAAMLTVSREVPSILPGLVSIKAVAMAAYGKCDADSLSLLRRQANACANAIASLRASMMGAVAMAHFFNGDDRQAKKLMARAIEIHPEQGRAETDATLHRGSGNMFVDWATFVQGTFLRARRTRRRP
jgi:hypothetical protein